MACRGCGARYRGVSSIPRRRLIPPKYVNGVKPAKLLPVPATPRTVNPETAIGLMANITNSIPK